MYNLGFILVSKTREQLDLCVAGEGTLKTHDSQNTSFHDHEFLGACFRILLYLDRGSFDTHIVAKHLM